MIFLQELSGRLISYGTRVTQTTSIPSIIGIPAKSSQAYWEIPLSPTTLSIAQRKYLLIVPRPQEYIMRCGQVIGGIASR